MGVEAPRWSRRVGQGDIAAAPLLTLSLAEDPVSGTVKPTLWGHCASTITGNISLLGVFWVDSHCRHWIVVWFCWIIKKPFMCYGLILFSMDWPNQSGLMVADVQTC